MFFGTPRTIRDLVRHGEKRFAKVGLSFGHGTDNAFDEAAFITLEALGLPVDGLEAHWKSPVDAAGRNKVLALFAARIATRKPASYLLNKAYIQGRPFYVDERVIVPRSFIAEILCGEFSPAPPASQVHRVLDLCTGSGCLAVLAAQLFPQAQIDATELSPDAAAVARRNIAAYKMEDRLALYQGDLFAPLPPGVRYDVIIANPPYVDADGMNGLPPEFRAEPALALAAGADGLDLVHRIIAAAPHYLSPRGVLVCEIGRCRPALQAAYPGLAFGWCETAHSSGEVFFCQRR